MSTEDKVRKKNAVFNKLPFRPTCLVVSVIFAAAYLTFDYYSREESNLGGLEILKGLCGLVSTSVFVSLLLSYTDIEEKTNRAAQNSINVWRAEVKNNIEEIENGIKHILAQYDYMTNSNELSLEHLNNEYLDKVMKSAAKQKLARMEAGAYSEIANYYLQRFIKFQNGHLYHYYKRTIILEPDSANKTLFVEMKINFFEEIPDVPQSRYMYEPRFKSREEAITLQVKVTINGTTVKPINNMSAVLCGDGNNYFKEYEFDLIPNSKNEFVLSATYTYILDENNSFCESYYLQDPAYVFEFKCMVIGSEAKQWHIEMVNSGYKNTKNIKLKSGYENETVKVLKTPEDSWVSDGVTSLNVYRKRENNV